MYQYIEQLRKKSPYHKRRVALGASGVITASIFVAWLSVVLPSNVSQIVSESQSAQAASANVPDEVTPLDTLKKSSAQVYEAAKSLLNVSVPDVDLKSDYDKMKTQVQTGQIKVTPTDNSADIETN